MDTQPLLLIATGSSATIVLSAYLAELRPAVGRIDVLMTRTAERFVSAEVVGWFADRVFTCDSPGLNPVAVTLGARATVVLPASANTLAAAALGLMPTPAATAVVASPAPVLYLPHMNGHLWTKPIIQQHIATLRARGDAVIDLAEDETYEISSQSNTVGLSMPDPEQATAIVTAWLAGRAEADPGIRLDDPFLSEAPEPGWALAD